MKLVTFKINTPVGPMQRIGAIINETKIVDLTSGYAAYLREAGEETRLYEAANLRLPPDMIGYLKGGGLSKKAAQQTLDYASQQLKQKKDAGGPQGEKVIYNKTEVKLMAPVPHPNTMRSSATWENHGSRVGMPKTELWYKYPTPHARYASAVIGLDEPIICPSYCKYFDCELELGFYIGKEGRDIPLEKAEDYVGGYTIFNDATARDMIFKDGVHEEKAKGFSGVMGPCLVTPDEIDPKNLTVYFRVNGELWFKGNTGTRRQFYTAELVAYYSANVTLFPGDFCTGGTVDRACGIDIGKWIKPGDVVEFEIEGIGILRNPIVQGDSPVIDYVANGMPGHLEYKGPPGYEKSLKFPWEKGDLKPLAVFDEKKPSPGN